MNVQYNITDQHLLTKEDDHNILYSKKLKTVSTITPSYKIDMCVYVCVHVYTYYIWGGVYMLSDND